MPALSCSGGCTVARISGRYTRSGSSNEGYNVAANSILKLSYIIASCRCSSHGTTRQSKWVCNVWLAATLSIALINFALAAEEYTISDEFDGCDYGKLYELDEGGILECLEYNYFYEYKPTVIACGREVILIGDERVRAHLHDGSVYKTHISGDFEGCDFDSVYTLDNGLLFQCATYHYHYAYRPAVTIFVIEGRAPVVIIDGDEYDGTLFRY